MVAVKCYQRYQSFVSGRCDYEVVAVSECPSLSAGSLSSDNIFIRKYLPVTGVQRYTHDAMYSVYSEVTVGLMRDFIDSGLHTILSSWLELKEEPSQQFVCQDDGRASSSLYKWIQAPIAYP